MITSKSYWPIGIPALAIAIVALIGWQSTNLKVEGHQYILALYAAPDNPGGNAKEYGDWARAHHRGAARVSGGDELAPAVATLGSRESPSGPQLVGFFRVAADNDADAVALAKTTPHLRYGGSVTIRPTVE